MGNALKLTFKKYSPVTILALSVIGISTITRLAILFGFQNIHGSFLQIARVFAIGLFYDLLVAIIISLPFLLHITISNNYQYSKTGRWVVIAANALLLGILVFSPLLPKEFNADLFKAIIAIVVLRFLVFLFLLAMPSRFRLRWRSATLLIMLTLTIFFLLFNGVSEWFFWNEFASRYNFIAVDYLVYTNEVVGNIVESYPILKIVLVILFFTIAIIFLFRKEISTSVNAPLNIGKRLVVTSAIALIAILLAFVLKPQLKNFSKNNYMNELAGNGLYDFVQAFKNNELDFFRYYQTIPDTKAFSIMRTELETPQSPMSSGTLTDLRRTVTDPLPENRMNVVLISVESLSAHYLEAFGDPYKLTPYLNELARSGYLFTNLYASGTRTVRGLEALTLSLPPLPGQSLVKRDSNSHLFTLGSVLKEHGYTSQYLYGGYSYFDNMKAFFSGNDYEVVDRDALKANEIHYANIWGVADEDLFSLATKKMDEDFLKGKPFFTHVMTVSNHRPYTYPEGRIDIPPAEHSRGGAVKYTDYAIGTFIKNASSKPWFKNTLFVIVADHCASSAGSQDLPLSGYHIPMIIYSPELKEPKKIDALMGQVDIAPTIIGLLHLDYTSRFFGQDIFTTPPEKRRAFLSTYQGLGFLRNDTLIVQSPVKKVKAYKVSLSSDSTTEISVPEGLKETAIAYYQTASRLIDRKTFRANVKN